MIQSEKDLLKAEVEVDIQRKSTIIGALAKKLDDKVAVSNLPTFYTSESETAFEDEMRSRAATANTDQIRQEMEQLEQSPYFARLDVEFDDASERPYYIAKYSAAELGIYSWTAPIAAVRFESPGVVSYQTPRDGLREGKMSRRDQYMIAAGHLNFMTTEVTGEERELIYQEHFSGRKNGFVLPEVVAKMEKAQDQVVRAGHIGPFAISGPAGSGKTTLALHRVAFLRQTPETSELYPAESILVLVQDESTEDYFSHLLPELGIRDVEITTFPRWAISTLGIGDHFYHARPGHNEAERDRYEWAKLLAIRMPALPVNSSELKWPNRLLIAHYTGKLNEGQMGLLRSELEEGALDRYDLTLLLGMKKAAEGRIMGPREVKTYSSGGRAKTHIIQAPLEYSLILVDEFQNYMPEQLKLIRSTQNTLKSICYVGDIRQQTQFGPLQNWSEIDEFIAPERAIQLEKVYRNTRQILEYIRTKGYTVDIPEGVSSGPEVREREAKDVVETLQYIVGLTRVPGELMGIISKDPAVVATYRDYFADDSSVQALTMREAQGVEFDIVCLVGIDESCFATSEDNVELKIEQTRINRDLLYVAMTRAIRELHIIGSNLDVLNNLPQD